MLWDTQWSLVAIWTKDTHVLDRNHISCRTKHICLLDKSIFVSRQIIFVFGNWERYKRECCIRKNAARIRFQDEEREKKSVETFSILRYHFICGKSYFSRGQFPYLWEKSKMWRGSSLKRGKACWVTFKSCFMIWFE